MDSDTKKKIIKIARYYIYNKKATFEIISKKFNMSKSTVWKYLNITLKEIDDKLWIKVQDKKKANIKRSRSFFMKNTVSECFIRKLFRK